MTKRAPPYPKDMTRARWDDHRVAQAKKRPAEGHPDLSQPAEHERVDLTYQMVLSLADKACETCAGKGWFRVHKPSETGLASAYEACGCAIRRALDLPGCDRDGVTGGLYIDLRKSPETRAFMKYMVDELAAKEREAKAAAPVPVEEAEPKSDGT